jgi:hypothetical protein
MLASIGLGCEGGLATLLSLFLAVLGVNPTAQFGETGQVDFNVVQVTETQDEDGAASDEPATADEEVEYEVEVTDPPDCEATVDDVSTDAAEELGTFTILMDSSGSMEREYDADVCADCPFDKDRRRVDAAKILIEGILEKSPDSRIGLFDFGAGTSGDFEATRELHSYTSDVTSLAKAADLATSEEGTYIYDSTYELLGSMDSDISENFQATPITKALIVITDGEDTHSNRSLDEVIARAKDLEIPVHVVGLGKASEQYFQTGGADNADLVEILRRLASETGGFYASVSSPEDLEQLAQTIVIGLTGGYETLSVTLDPVPPSGTLVTGRIRVKSKGSTSDEDAPFQSWSFRAP